MTTRVTAIFYILVQMGMMNFKHSLSSSFILTLVTVKHVFFITAGDQLREVSQVKHIFNDYQIIIFVTDLRNQVISVEDYQIKDRAADAVFARVG
jgi:hypothetical protein